VDRLWEEVERVKPAAFKYERPESVGEALDLLARHGFDAKVLAGGQSLVPMMNLRLARPGVVVDVNRATDLEDDIQVRQGALWMGALTRHHTVAVSPEVAGHLPALAEGARRIGHLAIRMRGTVGGSLAHADPAAEWPMMAVAFGVVVHIESPRGRRAVPAREFFCGVFTTVLEPDELVVGMEWPLPAGAFGDAVYEFSVRPGDFALAAAAARIRLDPDGRVSEASVALAGVGDGPVAATTVERTAVGAESPADLTEAAHHVGADIRPPADLHASAAYRTHLAEQLTARALVAAWERAGAAEQGGDRRGGGR
jgi:carbon-monoxide dehydrogenase medium subunit